MSKTYKGIDLKNALKHYGRPGMKKGRHLPGTTWWQEATDGWRRAKFEAGLRAKLPKTWTSERNAAVSKADSQAAGSSGNTWEEMHRQLDYELRKQRVKPTKGKIPNIRPQKRAMDAADEAKRRALEEEDIRRAAEIHGITPEEERQRRVRGTLHQYVRDAQDRVDEDKEQQRRYDKEKRRIDAEQEKRAKEREERDEQYRKRRQFEKEKEEAERKRREKDEEDAAAVEAIRKIREERQRKKEAEDRAKRLKERIRKGHPKWV